MNRFKMLVIGAAFSSLPGLLLAQTFSGRVTSSFYAFERSDSIDVTSTHGRGYQTFQFDYGTDHLLFRTYAQIDHDFVTRLAGDGKVRMYNFYLQWRDSARRAQVKLGRQPVFGGVAVGTIDGVQINARLASWLRLKAFGGGLLPADQRFKLIEDLDENYLAGGQAILAPNADLNISLSYFDRRQKRPGYNALRPDQFGNLLTQFVEPSVRAFEFASVDATWYVKPGTSIYGRSDYDLNSDQLTRAEFSIKSEVSSRVTLNGSYTFRSPRLPWNSLFSLFNVDDNHEVEGGVYYRHTSSLGLYANAAGIFYTGEQSLRSTVGIDHRYGNLNYVHRAGFAGKLDGINAGVQVPLHQGRILPNAQLSWASYALDSGEGERQDLFAGAAGLLLRPWNLLTIDGQLQLLHNRFYSNDWRFLFRLQYWFFNRSGQ